jgi:glycosyltransferase involved in cell wall biosynthesis
MDVLFINTIDKKGGAAKVAYSIKQELEKKGHQTSMFVGRKYSGDDNIKILNDVRSFSGRVRKKLAYYLSNDMDVFSSDHILNTEQFKRADVIHCHNLHGNYFNLNTLKKISALKPVVWTLHDMWPVTAHCAHAFDGKLQSNGFFACPGLSIPPAIAWHNEKYLENKKADIYKNSKLNIVTPSKWLAGKVSQSSLKDKPLSVIYNGIDTTVFKPSPRSDLAKSRSDLGLPQDKKIVLIVAKGGALNPWKGGNHARDIISAFRANLGLFFVDLGGDSTQDGANFKAVSYIANPAILARYYSVADVLLYPSLADNCPLVVLEAMACGLPVVAFETGGIPELIEHKINGYIAGYRNLGELKEGVEYLTGLSVQEIEKMRNYSVNKISQGFTAVKMTDQYLELYKNLTK